jgi:hypothetical protein
VNILESLARPIYSEALKFNFNGKFPQGIWKEEKQKNNVQKYIDQRL